MPANTGAGFVLAVLSIAFGFAMVWYMWWLAIASFIGIVGFTIFHTFNYQRDYHLTLDEVVRAEQERTQLLAARS
jgi:cytochrome o ubiquinol oxidase subunit 1